jgi:hypothetical protein
MKRTIVLISFIALMLAACEPEFIPTPPTYVPADTPLPAHTPIPFPTEIQISNHLPLATPISTALTPAQQAAVASLASTLNVSADQIKLVSTSAVIWPDGCMGVQRIGMMCARLQIPGYVILLEANGTQYEFHTSQDGTQITPAGGIQASGSASEAVIKQLASNLDISAKDIQLVSSAQVEWPDSCLGVAREGVMCAQMVMPGYLIILQANGRQYEYHTNTDASRIVPGTLALTWKRSGGIAGFCDSLTIYASGEIYGYSCKSQPNEEAGVLRNLASSADVQQFYGWLDKYGAVNSDLSDPAGVSDRMTRQLLLLGSGNAQPNNADQQMLFSWAQDLFQRLNQ